jgi:hypothetical protein
MERWRCGTLFAIMIVLIDFISRRWSTTYYFACLLACYTDTNSSLGFLGCLGLHGSLAFV